MLLGPGPSIFSKSPYEFTKERQRMRLSLPLIQQPVMYPPPRGYVLVRFLSRMEQMYKQPHFDFEAHFPLNSDGGLELGMVKVTWGLETCTPIDPERYKLFQPGKNDYLSPIAVHTLSQPRLRSICVVEPHVSSITKVQRACRRFVVDIIYGITYLSEYTTRRTSFYIEYRTSLPRYYRAAQEKRRELASNYNQWHDAWERELGPGSLFLTLLLFLFFLLFLFLNSGYVDIRLRARLLSWFWTGSFGLPADP